MNLIKIFNRDCCMGFYPYCLHINSSVVLCACARFVTRNNVWQHQRKCKRIKRRIIITYHARIVSLSTRKEANVHCVLNTGNVHGRTPRRVAARTGPQLLVDPWFILSSSILPSGANQVQQQQQQLASLYVYLNADPAALYLNASIIIRA